MYSQFEVASSEVAKYYTSPVNSLKTFRRWLYVYTGSFLFSRLLLCLSVSALHFRFLPLFCFALSFFESASFRVGVSLSVIHVVLSVYLCVVVALIMSACSTQAGQDQARISPRFTLVVLTLSNAQPFECAAQTQL